MNQTIANLLLLLLATVASRAQSKCGYDTTIFTFGDSNSDTGGAVAGVGVPVPLPYGRQFFGRSTGRFSDGRLILDFLCESLNTRYLSPYLDSLGNTEFRNGANFAVAGSATLPRDVPFSLHIQVLQFLRFRSQTLAAQGSRKFNEEKFRKALYVVDIGQNDLARAFARGWSYEKIVGIIPDVLSEIKTAIERVYGTGGRNFWVHNTGPLGCLPQILSMARERNNNLDPNGCLCYLNDAARKLNEGLSALCDELSSELKYATIAYTDIYTIKYDLIANHANYGFKSPLMACCGFGGPPYNYNANVTCGYPNAQVCRQGRQFISWDGIHYTEVANHIVASKILSTDYTKPKLKFDYFCNIELINKERMIEQYI